MSHIWRREENNYEGFPGEFVGVVVETGSKTGLLSITSGDILLFDFEVSLPRTDKKKGVAEFEKWMNDIMDATIELKSKKLVNA